MNSKSGSSPNVFTDEVLTRNGTRDGTSMSRPKPKVPEDDATQKSDAAQEETLREAASIEREMRKAPRPRIKFSNAKDRDIRGGSGFHLTVMKDHGQASTVQEDIESSNALPSV